MSNAEMEQPGTEKNWREPSQESPSFETEEKAQAKEKLGELLSNSEKETEQLGEDRKWQEHSQENTSHEEKNEVRPQNQRGLAGEESETASYENLEQITATKPAASKKETSISGNKPPINAERKENEPGTKRSVLPFNVVMLKQDKQNWQKKQQKEKIAATSEIVVKDRVAAEYSYQYPALTLLSPPVQIEVSPDWVHKQKDILNSTFKSFHVSAHVVNVTQGPSVTRFEVQPAPGVKVNKITNLSDDIKLSLAARDVRIEAPIPGKHTIGIEVPNEKSRPVCISELIRNEAFTESTSPLTAVLGLDISGAPVTCDLRKMPHGLIAGATGSGKSVCINSIIISLLFKANPEEVKLLLIDPKMVELAPYNEIPHLVSPVITDVKAATQALKWAVDEMEHRYELFAAAGVRDISRYNGMAIEVGKLPYVVIIIDELADLMMMSPADVEEAICRIAQKARACGIHLLIATQRPSVDVITGLIKANVPTRIAFSVSSQVDSRTIIDMSGAEKLLGKGDMLYLGNGSSKPVRLQGTFVSDEEIDEVVAHVKKQAEPNYLFEQEELIKKAQINEDEDELFLEACEFVVENGTASTSGLQRRFKIGYNRAARLIDLMEEQGYISEAKGSKPRDVLLSESDLESILDENL
ncbi:DNA translocase FtsK [Bacillaceae bacterium Marseille-Q3522]|nr:DNA translocase FtsK [Bacillaceae bacterium Marseille-Q3522]